MTKPLLLLAGYGRFGAFAAGFLKRRFEVHVLDTRRGLKLAPGLSSASPGDLGNFDLLIFALPAPQLKKFLARHGSTLRRGAFAADVCAVKSAPMAWMRRFLPPEVSFAGLHPLFGPESAADGLSGHTIAVCRGRSSRSCHRRLLAAIRSFGLQPVETDPVIHDRTMASTLFLTQITGSVLTSVPVPARVPYETPAFGHLKALRAIAAGNSTALAKELLRYNPYCSSVLKRANKGLRREFRRLAGISAVD